MRRTIVMAVVVIAAAGAGAGAYLIHARQQVPAHPHPASSGESEHGQGVDNAMGAMLVTYDAPDGSTPCETAYLAFKASQDYAAEHQVKAVVTWLAPRQDFLDKCATLPPATQLCLAPRYIAVHRNECEKAKPSPDVIAALVKMTTASEPIGH